MNAPPRFALDLVHEGQVLYTLPLGDTQILAGRSPSNALVLSAGDVSWHHAAIWREDDRVLVNDLSSTNGTWLNGQRVQQPTALPPGAELRLGSATLLRLRPLPDNARQGGRVSLVVEVLDTRERIPVVGDRFRIGPEPTADLRLKAAPPTTLVVYEDGEVWLGVADADRRLALDEVFVVGGRRLRVLPRNDGHVPTDVIGLSHYPYRVAVRLSGGVSMATVEDPTRGITCEVSADSRVALVYVLARQLKADLERGVPAAELGWLDDEEVGLGIWGRRWRDHSRSHLNVVVHRLRRQLTDASLDPWCIEKKRRRMRLRAEHVDLG